MSLRPLAVVAALALAGCSSPAPPSAPAAAPAPPAASAGHEHHHEAAAAAASGAPGGILVVHAAEDLRATLTQLVPKFEEAFPGLRVAAAYGTGDEHTRHILDGAAIDVYLAAGPAADDLAVAGKVRGTPAVVARNPVVIAVRRTGDRVTGPADLATARVALCVASTPCGRAGRSALDAAGVPAPTDPGEADPAAALSRVRAGGADAALVRRGDLAGAGDLRTIDFAPANRVADEFTAIRPTTGRNAIGADAFVSFLGSALARHVFADAGLSPA